MKTVEVAKGPVEGGVDVESPAGGSTSINFGKSSQDCHNWFIFCLKPQASEKDAISSAFEDSKIVSVVVAITQSVDEKLSEHS